MNKKSNLNLVKGKPYLVKHENGKQKVRRVFRGKEKRFGSIDCFVFSSKVNKGVYAEITELENGVSFFTWKNTSSVPAREISIPFYDIVSVEEIN